VKTVECFLTRNDDVLMLRGDDQMLTPLVTEVRSGESPIEASVRLIIEQTGLHLSPSCAGLYFRLKPGHLTEDGLAFVAEVTDQMIVTGLVASKQEWVEVDGISSRSDVSPSYQQQTARFLAADHPLAVVLAEGESSETSGESKVVVAALDPAVLSPLVFAIQP
jgi:hypothetical protein